MDSIITSMCQMFMAMTVLLLTVIALIGADILLREIRQKDKEERCEDIYGCPYDDLYTEANYEYEDEENESST